MFRILKVELTNFRSFLGTHEWVLNGRPGLYYLTGANNDNPRLSRNGIGKSSLLDAICWCLYGKTTRGLRGADVISRGLSTCSVSVNLIVGDEEFTVKATQNPNSIKIDDVPVDRETLIKKLRLNFESFLYSIIIPQAGNSFLDLSPGKKLELFSSIMDLDFWLEKSKEADTEATSIEKKKLVIESNIARLNGSIASITSAIEELKAKSKEFDAKKAERVSQLIEKQNSLILEIRNLKDQTSQLEHEITLLAPLISNAENSVIKQEKTLKELNLELIEADKELSLIEHKLRVANEGFTQLEKVGAICSTCRQKVDAKHLSKEFKKLKEEQDLLEKERADLKIAKKEINEDKSKIVMKASKSDVILLDLRAKESKLKGNKNSFNSEVIYLERERTRLDSEIKGVKELKNDFSQMLFDKRNELKHLKESIEDKNSEIVKLNEEYAAIHFWVAGFKRLRLNIIEETLQSLEIEVNNNLVALGLGDWKIEFDVERENKSGGITKGFIALITDPKGYVAPYETMSFGETQRIKLAGSFGLANLIVERVGLISGTELYDEPSSHMSAEGIEDTLNALRDRSINSEREIWCIDHHALEYPDFNGTVNIIKDENGSKFAV